jgi:predicted nucleotidyltransferase
MSLFMFGKRTRQSAEHDLSEFLNALKAALDQHLSSLVLFGSMASSEFREIHSDVNLLVVLNQVSGDEIAALAGPLHRWLKRGHVAPLVLSATELPAVARDHPIEFLDILDHHRILFGSDVLAGLTVDRRYLRAQCEHDLSLLVLKVRQGLAAAGGDKTKQRSLVTQSLPSAMALFRAAVRLEEDVPKLSKIDAVQRLAAKVELDTSKLQDPVEPVSDYLAQIEKVLEYLRRK